jgi:hypothetical protein
LSIAPPTTHGAFARIVYELIKERNGNWFTEVVFPLLSVCAITTEIVLFRDAGAPVNVFTGVGGIIIGGLYGTTFLRKWFPGR